MPTCLPLSIWQQCHLMNGSSGSCFNAQGWCQVEWVKRQSCASPTSSWTRDERLTNRVPAELPSCWVAELQPTGFNQLPRQPARTGGRGARHTRRPSTLDEVARQRSGVFPVCLLTERSNQRPRLTEIGGTSEIYLLDVRCP
eukprot:1001246-Prorocentrum_minimum.AAC.1